MINQLQEYVSLFNKAGLTEKERQYFIVKENKKMLLKNYKGFEIVEVNKNGKIKWGINHNGQDMYFPTMADAKKYIDEFISTSELLKSLQ